MNTQYKTGPIMPKQYYPDGIAITQTIQQVAGAIGIAVMVSLLSAKQTSYLGTVSNDLTEATASGSSLVFKISLLLAVINIVLSFFIKNPVALKAKSLVNAAETVHKG